MAHRGEALLNVSFFGVRGSTPCPCDENRRYGGNTSCVQLERPGTTRSCSTWAPACASSAAPALRRVVPGLGPGHPHALGPRAGPAVLRPDPGARAPSSTSTARPRRPARWPRRSTSSCGRRSSRSRSRSCTGRSPSTTSPTATSRSTAPRCGCAPVPHVGANNGYRVEVGRGHGRLPGRPPDAARRQPPVSDACSSCATAPTSSSTTPSTPTTSSPRSTTGGTARSTTRCSWRTEAGAKRLALFHHDPAHDDDTVDALLATPAARPRPPAVRGPRRLRGPHRHLRRLRAARLRRRSRRSRRSDAASPR